MENSDRPVTIWRPTWSLEERLRIAVTPAGLHLRYLAARERRRGEREYALLSSLVPPGRTALDVGANKGVWSFALLKLASRVHAFEPNPKIFPELERALRGKVALHRLALSDQGGTADFRVPWGGKGYSNQGGSLSALAVAGEHAVTEVTTARLDDLGITDVGFIKIDVEGGEFEVLAGAQETIARDRPVMIIELEERHSHRPIEVMLQDVEAYGYRGMALVDGRLTPWREIDFDRRHRAPHTPRPDYIFNFIFQPTP